MQRMVFQAGSLPKEVVCLTQVVSADELKDDEEYEDSLEDMRGEGGKYGQLVNVVIPRLGPNGEQGPGVGKVFLEYRDTDGATKAKVGLNGRKFGGSQVESGMTLITAEDLKASVIDLGNMNSLERALDQHKVSPFFTESPTNPFLRCINAKFVSELCHNKRALVFIVDTFASPVNQKAITMGADLVVHATT